MSPPLPLASVTPVFSFAPSLPCRWTVRLFWTSIIAVKLHQWLSCRQTCRPIKVRLVGQGAESRREKKSKTSLEKEGGREREKDRNRHRDYSISKLGKSGVNSINWVGGHSVLCSDGIKAYLFNWFLSVLRIHYMLWGTLISTLL